MQVSVWAKYQDPQKDVSTVLRAGLPGSGQVNHVQKKSWHSNTWHWCIRLGSCTGKTCPSHTQQLWLLGYTSRKTVALELQNQPIPDKAYLPAFPGEECLLPTGASMRTACWLKTRDHWPSGVQWSYIYSTTESYPVKERSSRDMGLAKKRKKEHSRQFPTSNCKEVQVSTPYASELAFWFFPLFFGRAELMHARTCSWKSGGAGSANLQQGHQREFHAT